MNTSRFFAMVVLLLLWFYLPTQALKGSLPVPATSPNQLFYLQRSKDANTVIYEANLTADRKLNPEKPVAVYWIRYAERGQREDLSQVQWQMAYGYSHRRLSAGANAYELYMNAFRKRPLHIAYQQGKPVAMMQINGQRACLHKVFVQVDPKARLIPRVEFVELFGADANTGRPVRERIIPD